jgi:NTE family protein
VPGPAADRPCFGLALSGGAVRGAAQIGVLRVLEEAGLAPQRLAGTSVGAIVGAAWAAGRSPDAIADAFRAQDWFSLVGLTLKLTHGLVDTRRLAAALRDELGLATFAELRVPFAAVACDLASGEAVVLRDGDLVEAVLASTAIPGLFPPSELGGRTLVDGGVVDILPVDVVREMGADYVAGVDLLPLAPLAEPPRGLFETWQRSLFLVIRANRPADEGADLLIAPDIADFSFTDFSQVDALIRRGEEATRLALPALREALGRPAGGSG